MQVSAHASSEGMVAPDDELPQLKGTLQLSVSCIRRDRGEERSSGCAHGRPG